MRFLTREQTSDYFRGKTVAIVGSAPSVLNNASDFVDSHEVVVRVNNYKLGDAQGRRADVHYSFYGSSIRKTAEELKRDGVYLCMCKCPDAKPIECDWHERMGKTNGIDFRYIYQARKNFWFCDTYVPDKASFLELFTLLGNHIASTGFAAIQDLLSFEPESVYLTGFDFFSSGVHNVDEPWRKGDPSDPIGHRTDLELAWLADNASQYPVSFDKKLAKIIAAQFPQAAVVA